MMKYKWIDEQDREFIKEVCGDYAEDIMGLIQDYVVVEKKLGIELEE